VIPAPLRTVAISVVATLVVVGAAILGLERWGDDPGRSDLENVGLREPPASPEAPEEVDMYSADNEANFSHGDHTCNELKTWYDRNPGDSNPAIAEQYGETCEADPPPVLNGELSRDDLSYELPIDVAVLNCEYDPYLFGDVGLAEIGFSNNTDSDAVRIVTLRWELGDETQIFRKEWTVGPDEVDIWAPDIATRPGLSDGAMPTCTLSLSNM